MAESKTPAPRDEYERPVLRDYGTIEEWTKGRLAQPIVISIIV